MVTRDVTGLSELHALLGEGADFEGTLTFEGRVRIDGGFRGKVFSPGVLILGHHAKVDARIEVGTLIVLGGEVHGEVVAERAVELHAPAKVYANVCSPQLMVDRGAVFEGSSRRPSTRPETTDEPEPAGPDAEAKSEGALAGGPVEPPGPPSTEDGDTA